ncbi:eukaryotic translation initiation factor 5 isoform X2 [Cydia pomonella]|uniref:eukaryotic translation initiation factor 5 isoform X2 n=1 Tax=Cydia pomonella TaxID=82600 RepID=UPI002ADDC6A8|nr:eukaryotic translation initiation factor 5 isoform X2 [Cydia pomonella]
MGSLNVNRNVADAFYRYKMPRICAKVEGKGNGIKTVIVNMPEVAKALGRPATYPTKYFGCELGAQTQFDYKNERFIVNGSHDSAKLQDLLDGFIRKFVLCPECDNPETELIVSTKRNTISQGCKACGYHGTLDFSHKLNTFILKNPPTKDPSTEGSSLTEGNRGKRSKRSGPGAANGNHDDSSDAKPESETPVTPVAPTPKSKKEHKHKHDDDDDDGTWTVDVSDAAVRARMQDLTEGAKSMTLSEDSEKNEKQRMDLFYAYLKQKAAAGDVTSTKACTDLLHEAERLEVKSKAPLVLFELLYDLDIVEEKAIVEWFNKPSRKALSKEVAAEVRRRAQPFLDWLQQAEEDSDEDDEGELEIEYNDRAAATPMKAQAAAARAPRDDDDNDLDIDAI